jgi:hypothetical protein
MTDILRQSLLRRGESKVEGFAVTVAVPPVVVRAPALTLFTTALTRCTARRYCVLRATSQPGGQVQGLDPTAKTDSYHAGQGCRVTLQVGTAPRARVG